MKRTQRHRREAWAMLATIALVGGIVLLAPATAAGETPVAAATAVATEPAVDPGARAALDRMGAYLRGLPAYQVQVSSLHEEVLENGLKVQSEWTTNLLARQPDRLLIDVSSDAQDRSYFYDGKQFTLFAERVKYYATEPAPPTIAELARALEENYGIEVPLLDLFQWGTDADARDEITAAVDLGPATIGETTCHQYAFRQEGLDWQVWIQEGDFPLPRKVVLTTTTDEARPQFQATYTWNLAPSFNDAAFTFDPPADAHRIVFAKNSPDAGANP